MAAVACLLAADHLRVRRRHRQHLSSPKAVTRALNPAVTTSGNTHPVTDQIFNGLVGLDAELNPVAELAERWQIEDGGRTYRFTLEMACGGTMERPSPQRT